MPSQPWPAAPRRRDWQGAKAELAAPKRGGNQVAKAELAAPKRGGNQGAKAEPAAPKREGNQARRRADILDVSPGTVRPFSSVSFIQVYV